MSLYLSSGRKSKPEYNNIATSDIHTQKRDIPIAMAKEESRQVLVHSNIATD
jgi:hypothetical protein